MSNDNANCRQATSSLNRRRVLQGMAVGASAFGFGVQGVAASSHTEIAEPTVITEPGEYELTQDIEVGADESAAITIQINQSEDEVVINGNGHTITGPGTDTGTHGITAAESFVPKSISDLELTNLSRGVATEINDDWEFVNVSANHNATGFEIIDDFATLTECEAIGNVGTGISQSDIGGGLDCTDVTVADNGGSGLQIGGGEFTFDGCTVTGNGDDGLGLYFSSVTTITNSSFCANAGNGVYLADFSEGPRTEITNSTANNNGDYGVYVGSVSGETTVVSNTVLGNANGPFFVDEDAENVTIENNETEE